MGGNVSFYNEVEGEAIYPTPVVGAVGLLESPEKQCSIAFRQEGDLVYLLGSSTVSLGGSLLLKVLQRAVTGFLPPVDLALEKRLQRMLRKAVKDGLLVSAHDLSDGGLAVALAESSLADGLGVSVSLPGHPRPELPLFGEGPSRVIVSVDPSAEENLKQLAEQMNVPLLHLGEVGGISLEIRVGDTVAARAALSELKKIYEESIPCLMDQ